jgi:alpha-beta hydrolase superfamily lysophospholipase
MKTGPAKKKWLSYLRLVLWVLFIQFVLLNISTFLHAGKLTKFYPAASIKNETPPKNIFTKTWRLFSGPRYAKPVADVKPVYSYETVLFKTKDSTRIEAWYIKTDSVPKGTVVLFHGLGNSKSSVINEANEFRYIGYHVMLVDFRGHGNSGGLITTIGYREYEEVILAYDWLKQKGEQHIILFGTSMGAVAIIKALAENKMNISGAVLEMPFGSLHQHMKARAKTLGFPKQPFGAFVTLWTGIRRGFNGFKLNTYQNAEKVSCPVLFQWGNNDHLVPKAEAENIYQHMGSKQKKFVVYENGVHSSLLQQNITQWRIEVENFLKSLK